MSDVEETTSAVPAPVVAVDDTLTIEQALQTVLRNSLIHDGLARGLREAAKTLDKGVGRLCILNDGCDADEYTKLIEALCEERNVHLLRVGTGKQLGEWAGLCKIDRDGTARKIVACSCVVVREYGEQSRALEFLLSSIEKKD